jgi:hypothetical protein
VTHTVAILEISPAAYAEIKGKLLAANYEHCIDENDDGEFIDMTHIAVTPEKEQINGRT